MLKAFVLKLFFLSYLRTMFSPTRMYWIFVFAAGGLLFVHTGCKPKPKPFVGRYYDGQFFGENYSIDVVGDSTNYQKSIDSILFLFDGLFSLANPNSVLSQYNAYGNKDKSFELNDSSGMFGVVFDIMRDVSLKSQRFYDPTTNPVKRAWMGIQLNGMGVEPNLDSLYEFVGFDGAKMDLIESSSDGYTTSRYFIRKTDPRLEADFTALASSYAWDQVAEFFQKKNVPQFKITYGNRILTNGVYVDSLNVIRLGLDEETGGQQIRVINRAYAFKTAKDKAQMIDPTYGYPPDNEFVFVGVSAPTMWQSEVFAETFMIMGLNQASQWYEQEDNLNSDIQSFTLIRREDKLSSASTEGFDAMLIPADTTTIEAE
jgi:thiamine biosynthesis lipoprotein ApbE